MMNSFEKLCTCIGILLIFMCASAGETVSTVDVALLGFSGLAFLIRGTFRMIV